MPKPKGSTTYRTEVQLIRRSNGVEGDAQNYNIHNDAVTLVSGIHLEKSITGAGVDELSKGAL